MFRVRAVRLYVWQVRSEILVQQAWTEWPAHCTVGQGWIGPVWIGQAQVGLITPGSNTEENTTNAV